MFVRNSLLAQLDHQMMRADKEQKDRSSAEESLSQLRKEKAVLEKELKNSTSLHELEINRRDSQLAMVSFFY